MNESTNLPQIKSLLFRAKTCEPNTQGYDEGRELVIKAALMRSNLDSIDLTLIEDIQLESLHAGEINRVYNGLLTRIAALRRKRQI